LEIKPLTSFASGGRNIFVHGTNLNSVQQPEMAVYSYSESIAVNKTVCNVLNTNQMECPSPAVNYEFIVAGIRTARSLRKQSMLKVVYIFTYALNI